jgi:cation transport regulator ChaC
VGSGVVLRDPLLLRLGIVHAHIEEVCAEQVLAHLLGAVLRSLGSERALGKLTRVSSASTTTSARGHSPQNTAHLRELLDRLLSASLSASLRWTI